MSSFGNSTVTWRKGARCAQNGTCVEVGRLAARQVGARDAKNGVTGPVLAFSTMEWRAFTGRAKEGLFDLPR